MSYTVILSDEVRALLREMPRAVRREMGYRLALMENDMAGNVKKL
jgi:hypothetical protein